MITSFKFKGHSKYIGLYNNIGDKNSLFGQFSMLKFFIENERLLRRKNPINN